MTVKQTPLFLLVAALAIVGSFAQVGSVQAQDATPPPPAATPSDDEVNAVAKNMYCPVCENVPLDVCPTLACQQWRELIREKLAAGWSEQDVYDYFVLQYGDRVLAAPPPTGLNLLIYIAPPVLIAAAFYVVWQMMRRMRAAGNAVTAGSEMQPAKPKDEYQARLEDELKRLDRGD
ncbi:MAG: hypothetical protein EPO32_03325 [Anaerolineae bacterium]|nr:MAG: hypothetical protein EPO32_03325 [Anaerolineae bacterium]